VSVSHVLDGLLTSSLTTAIVSTVRRDMDTDPSLQPANLNRKVVSEFAGLGVVVTESHSTVRRIINAARDESFGLVGERNDVNVFLKTLNGIKHDVLTQAVYVAAPVSSSSSSSSSAASPSQAVRGIVWSNPALMEGRTYGDFWNFTVDTTQNIVDAAAGFPHYGVITATDALQQATILCEFLLTNQQIPDFTFVFNFFKTLLPDELLEREEIHITSDEDGAMLNAIETVFKNIKYQHTLCTWHKMKNVAKRRQDNGSEKPNVKAKKKDDKQASGRQVKKIKKNSAVAASSAAAAPVSAAIVTMDKESTMMV
jgi:hypothetical protein